jgi:hypothetical protein
MGQKADFQLPEKRMGQNADFQLPVKRMGQNADLQLIASEKNGSKSFQKLLHVLLGR